MNANYGLLSISVLALSALVSIHSFDQKASGDYYTNYIIPTSSGIPLSDSQLIGIQLSQNCLTMMKHNISSNCLSYKQLKVFDNTNPLFAGQWVTSPYYHRLAPRVMNHYNFNPNPFIVMVDPNPDFTTRARMIIVQSDNFSYNNPNDVNSGGVVKVHTDRFVGACETATVAPFVWLVNDTIKYLESNCVTTAYNDTKLIYPKHTPFTFNNPYSTLHYDKYVHDIKNTGGLKNCINYKCSYSDPYSNPGYYNMKRS